MKIKEFIFFFLILALFTAFQNPPELYSTKTGRISFRSDAPLELIKVSSDKVYGKFNPLTKDFAFSVAIKSFKGFNSLLQEEHFNENYMESGKYPSASFYGKVIEDINYNENGNITVRAKGNLIVHNVTQERIIRVSLQISGGKIIARSNFTILLSDHNIPIPKVVHEKLASEIKVEVLAELEKK